MPPKPVIIVICGAPGVGKSTLAHALSNALDIRHRAGTQTVMHTIRTVFPLRPAAQSIATLSAAISMTDLRRKMNQRAHFLRRALNFVLKRNKELGIPFILEGTHMFPRYLQHQNITLCITIAAPPKRMYIQWLTHPTLNQRYVHIPLILATKMNRIHVEEAKRARIPIIRDLNLRKRVAIVKRLLKRRGVSLPARV